MSVYDVKLGGSELVPVSDSDFSTEEMSTKSNYSEVYWTIVFIDADGVTPVTPTAGQITIKGEQMKGVTGLMQTVNASDVVCSTDGDATYTSMVFKGRIIKGLVSLSGVTGASYFNCQFWRV